MFKENKEYFFKIDNLFSMQIVNDEGNIQITITWIENEKKIIH